MLKFKTFLGTNLKTVEFEVNEYLRQHSIKEDELIEFSVKHDSGLSEHCVSILYNKK